MEDETAGPPVRKALSATAPAFKFSVSMEVPTEEEPATNGVTEGFSFNPESQEYTGKVPAKGEEEDKKDKKKFRTEDDLYLAEVLLAGETDGLLQDPSAGSVTDVNNHPFNSVLTPNFWDPSEKHDRASGNSGRHVFVMACKFFYLSIHLFLDAVYYDYQWGWWRLRMMMAMDECLLIYL